MRVKSECKNKDKKKYSVCTVCSLQSAVCMVCVLGWPLKRLHVERWSKDVAWACNSKTGVILRFKLIFKQNNFNWKHHTPWTPSWLLLRILPVRISSTNGRNTTKRNLTATEESKYNYMYVITSYTHAHFVKKKWQTEITCCNIYNLLHVFCGHLPDWGLFLAIVFTLCI